MNFSIEDFLSKRDQIRSFLREAIKDFLSLMENFIFCEVRSFKGNIRILAAIQHFNGTVHFSDVKICSHLRLSMHFFTAYFRKQATAK